MKFYDLMTLFWAGLLGAMAGVGVAAMAGGATKEGWTLGGIATAGMAVAVFFWREFKRP